MQRSDIPILLVEDDESSGKAMKTALDRHGYEVKWVQGADEAQSAFKIGEYRALVIDCMIPRVSGVDLAEQLRKENGHDDFVVILMSGIFKDRQFARDATRRTGAKHFLLKPVNNEDLLQLLDETFADELDEAKDPLQQVLNQQDLSDKARLQALQHTEYIHGFDLPLVYALLIGTNLSGELKITDSNQSDTTIYFSDGQVVRVAAKDDKSYFGVLLVEKGFTSPQEVEAGLAMKSDQPIGERLVSINSLSPHAIRIIHLEQMFIRLSQTIKDDSYHVQFKEKKVSVNDAPLDTRHFTPLLSDWIASKVDPHWLRSFFLPWLDFPLMESENFKNMNLYRTLPVFLHTPELTENIEGKTVQDILDSYGDNDIHALRALHFLLLTRAIVFNDRKLNEQDFKRRLNRLKKTFANMKEKDHFEILGLARKARASEIAQAYHDLAKALHPDRVPPHAPAKLRELTEQIFSRVTEAYKVLKDDKSRKRYLAELEHGQVEEALALEAQFEDAKRLLHRGRYKEAYKILRAINEKRGHRPDTVIYLIWARVKIGDVKNDFDAFVKRIKGLMSEVPHEDRHSALYFFVRGLYYKAVGNYEKAMKHLKHSTTLDPGFIEAKRELVLLKKDLLDRSNSRASGDISTVITRFFTKKKKAK